MSKPLVSIAGFDLPQPAPDGYQVTIIDLVDAGRNTEGDVIASVVQQNICRIDLTWNLMDIYTYSKILKLFLIDYGGSFINDVTFFSSVIADWETRKMYIGDRVANVPLVRYSSIEMKYGIPIGYKGVSLALIQAKRHRKG